LPIHLDRIRAAIFDLDGLMINSEPIALEVWRTTLASFGVVPSAQVYQRVIGLEPMRGVEIFIEAYDLDVRPGDLFIDYWALRTEVMARQVHAREGLLDLMRWFQAQGKRMAVASNSPQAYVDRIVSSIGVKDYLESAWGSDRVAAGKPAPDVYLAVAKELDLPAGSCLVIEDSPAGVAAAKAAGMICAAIPSEEMLAMDFDLADQSFESLLDLHQRFHSSVQQQRRN
jgi:HAD superfamily hydrolase (TIGR01509 family)